MMYCVLIIKSTVRTGYLYYYSRNLLRRLNDGVPLGHVRARKYQLAKVRRRGQLVLRSRGPALQLRPCHDTVRKDFNLVERLATKCVLE